MSGTIWNEDCRTGLSHVEEGSVDLVLMDPPYEFASVRGSGAFGSGNRAYHSELEGISHGIDAELLDLIMSKMRRVNAYVFCSKAQLPFYLGYFSDRGCNFDLLTWHKSNPTPACSNKYLSDTEYIVFARDPGVRLYGSYDTKRKWWVTPVNRRDRELYGHPTVKPLEIVRTLVENSTRGGGTSCWTPLWAQGRLPSRACSPDGTTWGSRWTRRTTPPRWSACVQRSRRPRGPRRRRSSRSD